MRSGAHPQHDVDGSRSEQQSLSERIAARQETASRGQAEQIDFLNAMVILLFGIGLFLAASSVVLNVAESGGASKQYIGQRVSDRVVKDLMVNDTDRVIANESCTEKFFTPSDADTGCPGLTLRDTGGTEEEYLQNMTGVSDFKSGVNEFTVNVTLERNNQIWVGDLNGDGDTDRYALGPAIPDQGEVTTFTQYVTFGDIDGDGHPEYFKIVLRVWT